MADDHHHYLHRVYLEGFTATTGPAKGKVWTLRNETIFAVAPRGIAKRQHYYTLPDHDQPRTLEDFFSMVEGHTVPFLKACLTEPYIPTGDERFWVTAYVAIHLLRVPSIRDSIQETFSNVMNTMLAVMASVPGNLEEVLVHTGASTKDEAAHDAAKMKEGIGHYKIRIADNGDAAMLIRGMDVVLEALNGMKIHIVFAEEGSTYITGDRPVLTSFPGQGMGGLGLGHKDVEVTFPLNSNALLMFTWDGEDSMGELPARAVHQVNLRTAAHSAELLIGVNGGRKPRSSGEQRARPPSWAASNGPAPTRPPHPVRGALRSRPRWTERPRDEGARNGCGQPSAKRIGCSPAFDAGRSPPSIASATAGTSTAPAPVRAPRARRVGDGPAPAIRHHRRARPAMQLGSAPTVTDCVAAE
jgi:hypothetical protein